MNYIFNNILYGPVNYLTFLSVRISQCCQNKTKYQQIKTNIAITGICN